MSYTTGIELDKRRNGSAYTMEQALRRVYLGKPHLCIPKVLWGKKFRIVLEEKSKK